MSMQNTIHLDGKYCANYLSYSDSIWKTWSEIKDIIYFVL